MVRFAIGVGVFGMAIALTLLAPNTYYLFILGMIGVTTLVSVGLNILVGLSGQVSIGHAGFFAIGTYTGSLLMLNADWSFWPALVMAMITSAGMGIALAIPALRVSGPYLAMVTIAFGIIVERILIEWVDLTGGFGGLTGMPKPALIGLTPSLRSTVLLVMGLAGLATLSFAQLKRHAWGRAMRAVRDDAIAAAALGLNPLYVRMVAFALSAAFTGVAGVFFAPIVGFVSPDSFTFHRSILFLLAVILGGLGAAEGALLGALVLVILPELLSDFAEYQLLVFGLLLLLTLRLSPDGIMSAFRRFNQPKAVYPLSEPSASLPLPMHQRHRSLEVKDVSIQFGGIRAVDGVSMTAQPGTVTAVIGPNGAGKTTLLNLIGGFYQAQAGSINLGSLSITDLDSQQIATLGISRTFQATRLFNSLSVVENLRTAAAGPSLGPIPLALFGMGRRHAQKAILEMLSFVGYRGNIHQSAAALSFGDRRLVELARALIADPQVLLLDEPAAGLSNANKSALAKLIRRIASSGIKVVLIEHDMDLVMDISDRVLVMESGQAIAWGTPTEVQQDPRVLAAYLGTETSVDSVSSTQASAKQVKERPEQTAASPLLTVTDLTGGYGRLKVLTDVSLAVYPGELVSIVGVNGAGKSTLLKSLLNLLPPWSGQVTFAEQSLSNVSAHQMAKRGVMLVPEGRQVFKTLTVVDNLRLGASYRQDKDISDDIEQMLNRFPRLRERQDQKAGLLSGGEQQMLAIARGLMARPRLLLLDEPSLGLAPQLVEGLYKTLGELRDEGLTILLVDQMASLALAIADRAYLLETGQIVRSGTAKELRDDPTFAESYLGPSITDCYTDFSD
ncbi:MAG: branched-chain amino acid ABC transporter ATP-binding protein/permease [Cyanobacteria bacterium P01_F01_bin.150]